MKKVLIIIVGFLFPTSIFAGGCFQDPIYTMNTPGKTTTSVNVRSVACMEGSSILTVLGSNESITIIGSTDGRYQIRRNDGKEGRVGEQFITPLGDTTKTLQVTEAPIETDSTETELSSEQKVMVEGLMQALMIKLDAMYVSDTQGKVGKLQLIIDTLPHVAEKYPQYTLILAYLSELLQLNLLMLK